MIRPAARVMLFRLSTAGVPDATMAYALPTLQRQPVTTG